MALVRMSRRAVLLDALGTILELRPPWPALVRELAHRGVHVDEDTARSALIAEMTYYKANCVTAGDRGSLAALRARCTEILREGLGGAADGVADLQEALLASIEFTPYADTHPGLEALREQDVALVVVSNWDISLHDVLDATGLSPLLDGAITSAEHGSQKPGPSIFAAGLDLAGVAAAGALHAGDDPVADVQGAQAAGIEPVFVARHGEPAPPGVWTVRSLTELARTLSSRWP